MKKKVLIFIDSLVCGGAERSLVSLLPLLDYSKIEVDLMLRGRNGIFERYVPQNVNIINYSDNCSSKFDKACSKLSKLAFSVALRVNKYLLKNTFNSPHLEWATRSWAIKSLPQKYDVAIAYSQGYPTYYVMDKVKADRKYVWLNCDITGTKHKIWYVKKYYSQYDGLVVVSDALYEIVCALGFVEKDKLHCIYDILNPEFVKKQATEPTQIIDCTPNDCVKITTVARMIIHQKGQDLAVKAGKILHNNGVKFKWYLVGGGRDFQYVKKMIKDEGLEDYMITTDTQENPFPYIKISDIYVQPSRYEGFGLTLTEAKILGKPIIATDFPSAHNQVTHLENGLIVGMRPEDIAEGILKLINNKQLMDTFSEANQQYNNTSAITESSKVMSLILE